MLKKFFDTAAIDAFAVAVAKEVRKAVPPSKQGGTVPQRRTQALDDRLRHLVTELVRHNKPNMYQKAKLGARLQDALLAEGYPAEFCKTVSFEMVKRVAVTRV